MSSFRLNFDMLDIFAQFETVSAWQRCHRFHVCKVEAINFVAFLAINNCLCFFCLSFWLLVAKITQLTFRRLFGAELKLIYAFCLKLILIIIIFFRPYSVDWEWGVRNCSVDAWKGARTDWAGLSKSNHTGWSGTVSSLHRFFMFQF